MRITEGCIPTALCNEVNFLGPAVRRDGWPSLVLDQCHVLQGASGYQRAPD